MSIRQDPEMLQYGRQLAALIDNALRRGQCPDPNNINYGRPWTNQSFAASVHATEGAVRSWRKRTRPTRPVNIVPILDALFGSNSDFTSARREMLISWRCAGGYCEEEPTPQAHPIQSSQFSDVAEVIRLLVSQPTPDNHGNQIIPYTLQIYPDTDCEIGTRRVEIGVTRPFAFVECDDYQPDRDSPFRGHVHPNTEQIGANGGTLITGPRDNRGRIHGAPLGEKPEVKMEPTGRQGDGRVTFSVRVPRNGFLVNAVDTVDTVDGTPDIDTRKAVLDAIFAEQFPKDQKQRLVVASVTVPTRSLKGDS